MATIIKATNADKAKYGTQTPHPVAPLYGWVWKNHQKIPVEYLGEGRGNPNYEALSPDGFVFDADETHTLLGFTL
jgi:hypothetical protein